MMMITGRVACRLRETCREIQKQAYSPTSSTGKADLFFFLGFLRKHLSYSLPPSLSLSFFPNLIVARAVQGYIRVSVSKIRYIYIYKHRGSSNRYGIVSYRIVSHVSQVSFYDIVLLFSLFSLLSLSLISLFYYPIPKNRENSFLLSCFGLF